MAPSSAATVTPVYSRGPSKKVLLVDDTPDIRMIITESLKLYGFEILSAETIYGGH